MKNILILTIGMMILFNGLLSAQDSVNVNMKTEARRLFAVKDYAKALPMFQELVNRYPKEPEYQFCTGICLVKLNIDPQEAIRLLKSPTVAEYNPLSLFYLGRALHMNYSFEDAIKAYSRFTVKATKSEIRQFDVERLVEMARNGIEYTITGQPVVVQSNSKIQSDQLPVITEINGTGKLIRKPIEFCTKTDIKSGFRSWMFLPSYTEANDYIYVSGYERRKRNNKQIFRIKNINHETWGFTEVLNDVINTPYDEDYPYFDSKTSTLYFSSTGHSSMGGYDIFKSVYDWNTKIWSTPQNLGFPINTPYDDFLYLVDEFSHSASFASNRNSGPNQLNLYRIKQVHDSTGIRFVNTDDIRNASQLQPVSISRQKPAETADSVSVPVISDMKVMKRDYNKVLAEALYLQIKADSCARITRDLRILAKETPEDSIKKQLVKDILRNDKQAKNTQREADLKFAEARNLKGQIDTTPEPVIPAEKINDIIVYQYKDTSAGMAVTEKVMRKKTDDFSIATRSPYSDTNPIPVGIVADSGLVYRIQLGVFSKAKPNNAFGGIKPVSFEQVQGGSILKYYAGFFYSLDSVSKALEILRSQGFPDAFIVAYLNGKLITTEKAKEIEFSGFRL